MFSRRSAVLVCGILISALLAGCSSSSSSGPDDQADTQAPNVSITYPLDDAVIGETVGIVAGATDGRTMATVEFYVDGAVAFTDSTPPYEYLWDASGESLASVHSIHALARDAAGNSASSDPVTVHCKWRQLVVDGDDYDACNLKRLCARSTATMVEFRVETYMGWEDPYAWLDGIDAALFLDTDSTASTGLCSNSGWPYWPNDIGADYAALVGWESDSLWVWVAADTAWQTFGPHDYVDIAWSSDHFEFGVALEDLGWPTVIDIVAGNNCHGFALDWAPEVGHVTYECTGDYIGGAKDRPAARALRRSDVNGRPRPFIDGSRE